MKKEMTFSVEKGLFEFVKREITFREKILSKRNYLRLNDERICEIAFEMVRDFFEKKKVKKEVKILELKREVLREKMKLNLIDNSKKGSDWLSRLRKEA